MLVKYGKCFMYIHIHAFQCKLGSVSMSVTLDHIASASWKICCGTYILTTINVIDRA